MQSYSFLIVFVNLYFYFEYFLNNISHKKIWYLGFWMVDIWMTNHDNIFFSFSLCIRRICKRKTSLVQYQLATESRFSLSSYWLTSLTIMSVSNDLGQWYKSIPPITRAWFSASIVVPVAARLGIVRPQQLVLFVKPIFQNFQVCYVPSPMKTF